MKLEIGFLATLTIIFVIAKLTGYIDWGWWLVFLPVLISLGITLLVFVVIAIVIIIAAVIS